MIFSDLDEILDPKFRAELIEKTQQFGIITVKLRFTLFYFNLFSQNWGGPKDYAYRTFLMTGDYFNRHRVHLDRLRKQGENNRLTKKVYCFPEYAGFHHSWLGDESMIASKLAAYSHIKEHKETSAEFIRHCLKEGASLFPGHKLQVDNQIPLLPYIEENREGKYKKYFI